MATDATVWGRMYAWLCGEVPATVLEAYRRAGPQVAEAMDLAEARRLECAIKGLGPWDVPRAVRAELVCAWNAFVLQTLGDEIVRADYECSPATTGLVPPETARQALAFYTVVEEWLTRARQARVDPGFQMDVQVPAPLPSWTDPVPGPAPGTLTEALLRVLRSVREGASRAMASFPATAPGPLQQVQLDHIREIHRTAEGQACSALERRAAGHEPHLRILAGTRTALELFHELGQLVADPWLAPGLPADAPVAAHPTATRYNGVYVPSLIPPHLSVRPLPGPGKPGFDPWCLSDPLARERLSKSGDARQALQRMWEMDLHPDITLALHAELQTALQWEQIAVPGYKAGRARYLDRCPWPTIYVAVQPVLFARTRVSPGERFALDVGRHDRARPFRRGILVGAFPEAQVP